MRTIGLRVTPKIIYFCVAEREDDNVTILVVDKIVVPIALNIPDRLSFLRILIYTIINQYEIDNAIIRRLEDNAQKVDLGRANIEGVIQELISNCRIQKYKTSKLAQLGIILERKLTEIKACVDGDNLFDVDNWDKYKKEERESILCALAASEL